MIRHIIFDLGNVLIHIHPDKVMKEFMECCHLTAEDIKKFYLSDLHLGFMGGQYEPEKFYRIMNKKFPTQLSPGEFLRIWELVIGEPKEGIEQIITLLSQRYILSVCSNTDPWHWQKVMREISLMKKFHHFFLSFEMKLNKPDPEVFKYLLHELNAKGQQCLFIDDTQENIKVAQELGFQTIWSSEPKEIEDKLKELNIL
jgi:HAD superfamily hydrolase (TIGR01509 family)